MKELKSLIVSSSQGHALPEESRKMFFQARLNSLTKYSGAFAQMLAEPLILDDTSEFRKGLPAFMQFLVLRCETIVFVLGGEVFGIAVINVRQQNRTGEIMVWVAPQFRQGYRNQKMIRMLTREALAPFLWERLKLVRVETRCAAINEHAISAAKNLRFSLIGIARLDFLIQGRLCDSVLLELVNPAYSIPPEEVLIHDYAASEPKPSAQPNHDERLRGELERQRTPSERDRGGWPTIDEPGDEDGFDASSVHAGEFE